MDISETDLNRMAQRFYEVASRDRDNVFLRMACKPAIVEALKAALEVIPDAAIVHRPNCRCVTEPVRGYPDRCKAIAPHVGTRCSLPKYHAYPHRAVAEDSRVTEEWSE